MKLSPLCLLFFMVAVCPGYPGAIDAADSLPATFVRGNANGDNEIELTDAAFLFGFLFLGGEPPPCRDAADTNDDGTLTITDGIFLLNFLFLGEASPPPPSPTAHCPGTDPTPDDLSCEIGDERPTHFPEVDFFPVRANAPGIRERSRMRLPQDPETGRYLALEGESFTLLVTASSNRLTRAGFSLVDPNEPETGNAETLRVFVDQPLGDPTQGGVDVGENLARFFLRDLDPWHDPLYLVDEVGLRVAGDGPLAPRAGLYIFSAAVVDDDCAPSTAATFELEVLESAAPEIFAWIEDTPTPQGAPLAHESDSGNPQIAGDAGFLFVVQGLPGGPQDAPPDGSTLAITTNLALGADDLTANFTPDPVVQGRFSWWVDPELFELPPGNITFELELGTAPDQDVHRVAVVLENRVSFENHVRPILTENCTGCHEQPDPDKGLELVAPGATPETIWRRIVNVFAAEPAITSSAAILVRPLFPQRSYLFHKLAGTHLGPAVQGEGDRMPQDAVNFLGEEPMHRIRSWIEQGAELD